MTLILSNLKPFLIFDPLLVRFNILTDLLIQIILLLIVIIFLQQLQTIILLLIIVFMLSLFSLHFVIVVWVLGTFVTLGLFFQEFVIVIIGVQLVSELLAVYFI
jgi:hypothetical protein